MNRKRALFWYEIGNLKWFLLGGLLLGAILLLGISGELHALTQSSAMARSRGFGWETFTFGQTFLQALEVATPIAIVLLGVMAAFQFSDYHNRNKREFIVSLPFTQQERFLMKVLVGFGVITIVWLVFGAGILALRAVYNPQIIRSYLLYPEYKIIMANDTFLHTLRTLMLLWLIVLAAYAVYMLVQSVVIHGVAGMLVGIGTMGAPAFLLLMILAYTETLAGTDTGTAFMRWLHHHDTCYRLSILFTGQSYYQDRFLLSADYYEESALVGPFVLVSYGYMTKLLIALALILVLILVITWLINAKQDGAGFGRIVPLKPVRLILSAGTAVCFGAGITWIFINVLEVETWFWTFLLLAAVCAGLFILFNKLLKKVIR